MAVFADSSFSYVPSRFQFFSFPFLYMCARSLSVLFSFPFSGLYELPTLVPSGAFLEFCSHDFHDPQAKVPRSLISYPLPPDVPYGLEIVVELLVPFF